VNQATGGREKIKSKKDDYNKKQPMSVQEIDNKNYANQLDEKPGTLQKYYGAFRNLAVVSDQDFDCRSMMYFSPADKNGKEQKPFNLDEYIRTHDFDYDELVKRPEKIVREYIKEASKDPDNGKLPPLDVVFLKMQEGLTRVVQLKMEEVKGKDRKTQEQFRKLENFVKDFPAVYRNVRTKMLKESPDEYKKVFKNHKTDNRISEAVGKQMTDNADALKVARSRGNKQDPDVIIIDQPEDKIIINPNKGGKKKNGKK